MNKTKVVSGAEKNQNDLGEILPGWPGYRTRAGRSGLDPIDARTEAAHTTGALMHRLLGGQIRNPIYLFILGVMGMLLLAPLGLAVSETVHGNPVSWDGWLIFLVTAGFGFAVLINFTKNLIGMFRR